MSVKNDFKILDMSYGNLRLMDQTGATIMLSITMLEQLINKTRFIRLRPPRCAHDYLELKGRK